MADAMKAMAHNPNELIAIVDEKDYVVGKTQRKNHAGGKLHREVAVLIVNPRDEILLQKRADDGRFSFSAAGHFKYDETYLQGAVRETEEELGVKIDKNKFRRIRKFRLATNLNDLINDRFVCLYEVRGDYRINNFHIQYQEVEAIEYYTADGIRKLLAERRTTSAFAEAMKTYLRG